MVNISDEAEFGSMLDNSGGEVIALVYMLV